MEIKLDVDDGYMGKLMADVHLPSDECMREAVGLLRWAIDMKRSGRMICLCDRNGQNLQMSNIPVLNKVQKD